MTYRAQTIGRTLISHVTPRVKRVTAAVRSAKPYASNNRRDAATLLLIASIASATVGALLIAFVDAPQVVAIFAAVGALLYIGHWVAS